MERKFEPDDMVVNKKTGQTGRIIGFMTGVPIKYLVKGEEFEEWMCEGCLLKAKG